MKELEYTSDSPQSIKVGDTDTDIYLAVTKDETPVNLSLATSIMFKVADSTNTFIKSVDIDIPDSTVEVGCLDVPLSTNTSELTSGLYYFEVWVVTNGKTDIYPSEGFKSFTINDNI